MSREDRLDDILIRWEDAAKGGQPLTPEEACQSDPSLLPDFTKLLSMLGLIQPILNGEAASASPDDLIGRIQAGRFTPVSYHAAGGLGLVFFADDTEVKRTVALKYMQTLAYLDPIARQRFVTEAEITGKLEHPGIVPVYGLGHDTDGRPYYAMRFIHGATLGDDIEKLHKNRERQDEAVWNVEFRRLLRSFVSVCQTIAYAHVRGVIHRDIKPANIMLGPYGETLVVDWGLAKRYAMPEPDDTVDPGYKPIVLTADPAGQTVYGKAKGSPAYMAPEQARGEWDRVGPHSDIYSIGATLYVLLTGQKPYSGKSSDEVINAVKAGRLQRPRRHRADIPQSLEAICLKAMAEKPENRYASAKELADDMDRWMADEPVTAFREPFLMRARRWMKRHRTVVSTSVATVFVAAQLLTVLGVALGVKNRELTQLNSDLVLAKGELASSNSELRDTNQQLEKAYHAGQEEFAEADSALRRIMASVFTRATTGSDSIATDLGDNAVKKYREYIVQYIQRNRDRPERRLEVAYALLKSGDANALVGTAESALGDYAEAQVTFEELDKEMPNNRSIRFGLACVLGQRGKKLNDDRRLSEGLPLLVQSRDIFEQLSRDPTLIPETRFSSSMTGGPHDSPAIRLADVTMALMIKIRIQLLQNLAVNVPTPPKELNQHIEWLQIALRTLTNGTDFPSNAVGVIQAKSTLLKMHLADLNIGAITIPEVETLLTQLVKLRTQYPLHDVLENEILSTELWLATAARAAGVPAQAEARLNRVIEQSQRLEDAKQGLVPLQLRAGSIITRAELWHERSLVAEDQKQPLKARQDRRMAQNILATLATLERPPLTVELDAVYLYIRMATSAMRDVATRSDAEGCYAAALQILEKIPRDAAGTETLNGIRVILLGAIANSRAVQGKTINEWLAKAEEALQQHERVSPADPLLVYAKVNIHFTKGLDKFSTRRNPLAAIAEFEASLKLLEAAIKADPTDLGYQFMASTAEFTIVMCLGDAAETRLKTRPNGDPEALAMIRRAISLLKKQPTLKFEDPERQRIVDFVYEQRKGVPEYLEMLEAKALGKK